MALQRIVIVVAAVAALALVLLVPRFFEEADDASVPVIQLRDARGAEPARRRCPAGAHPRAPAGGARRGASGGRPAGGAAAGAREHAPGAAALGRRGPVRRRRRGGRGWRHRRRRGRRWRHDRRGRRGRRWRHDRRRRRRGAVVTTATTAAAALVVAVVGTTTTRRLPGPGARPGSPARAGPRPAPGRRRRRRRMTAAGTTTGTTTDGGARDPAAARRRRSARRAGRAHGRSRPSRAAAGARAGAPRLRRRLLAGARTRILAAFVVLLAFSTLLSVLAIRQLLAVRTTDRVDNALTQEIEEFRALASEGSNPATGRPFGSDLAGIFRLYFAAQRARRGRVRDHLPRRTPVHRGVGRPRHPDRHAATRRSAGGASPAPQRGELETADSTVPLPRGAGPLRRAPARRLRGGRRPRRRAGGGGRRGPPRRARARLRAADRLRAGVGDRRPGALAAARAAPIPRARSRRPT